MEVDSIAVDEYEENVECDPVVDPQITLSQPLLKSEELMSEIVHCSQEFDERTFASSKQNSVKAKQTMEEKPVLVESVATQQEVFIIPNRESYKLRNADPLPDLPERKISAGLDETQDSESSHLQAYCDVERSRHESFSEQDYEPIARFRKLSAQKLLEENKKMTIPEVSAIQIEGYLSAFQESILTSADPMPENAPTEANLKKPIRHSESIDSDPIYRPFEVNHQSQDPENVQECPMAEKSQGITEHLISVLKGDAELIATSNDSGQPDKTPDIYLTAPEQGPDCESQETIELSDCSLDKPLAKATAGDDNSTHASPILMDQDMENHTVRLCKDADLQTAPSPSPEKDVSERKASPKNLMDLIFRKKKEVKEEQVLEKSQQESVHLPEDFSTSKIDKPIETGSSVPDQAKHDYGLDVISEPKAAQSVWTDTAQVISQSPPKSPMNHPDPSPIQRSQSNHPQVSSKPNMVTSLMPPEVETSMYDPYGNLLIVNQKVRNTTKEYSPVSPIVSSNPISYECFANSVLNSSESLHTSGRSIESMPKTDPMPHVIAPKSKSLSPFCSDTSHDEMSKISSVPMRTEVQPAFGVQKTKQEKGRISEQHQKSPKTVEKTNDEVMVQKSKANENISKEVALPKSEHQSMEITPNIREDKEPQQGSMMSVTENQRERGPKKDHSAKSKSPLATPNKTFENVSGYYQKDSRPVQNEPAIPVKAMNLTKSENTHDNRLSKELSPQHAMLQRRDKQHPSKTLLQDQVPSSVFSVDHTPSPPPLRSKVVDKITKPHHLASQSNEQPIQEYEPPSSPVEKQVKPIKLQPPKVSNLCLQPGERRSLDYSHFEFRKSGTPTNSSYQSVFREKEAAKATRPKSIYEMINMKGPAPYQSEIYEDIPVHQLSQSSPFLNEVLVGDVQGTESSVVLEQVQNAKAYSRHQNSAGKHQTHVQKKSRVSVLKESPATFRIT